MTRYKVVMDTTTTEHVALRIDEALSEPAALLLSAYFDSPGPFAGETFDTLGDNDPNALGMDDLLAVTLLDVRIRPGAVRRLLGEDRDTVSLLLGDIDTEKPLWEASADDLVAAERLRALLRAQDGIDWVIAAKIMSRKRPNLIPILDSRVINWIGGIKDQRWTALRECLQDKHRRDRVEALRPKGLTPRVTVLRLLDVAIWMRASENTNARKVRQKAGLPITPRQPRRR